MPASQALIESNRRNAQKSTGPRTIEGKQRSRRNGLKHGMTGQGVVVPEHDSGEVNRRAGALMVELDPQSTLGRMLVGQLATLSVRMERGARQEEAALSVRVRHAGEVFDRARRDQARRFFDSMADDPKANLRELRDSPEGVDLLLDAWSVLRAELVGVDDSHPWAANQLRRMAMLTGLRPSEVPGSRIEALSRAAWGYFGGLTSNDQAGLDNAARQAWARDRLLERIDHEVGGLLAHRNDLDLEVISLDRADAADVALFDPSREAALARRYESEARRGFFRSLKEFRQVETDFQAADRPTEEPESVEAADPLASCGDGSSPAIRAPRPIDSEVAPGLVRPVSMPDRFAQGLDGRVLEVGRANFGAV